MPPVPVPHKLLTPLSPKLSRKRFWIWSAVVIVIVAVAGFFFYRSSAPGPVKPIPLPPQFTAADRLQLQQLLMDKKDYAGALTQATQMSQTFPNVSDVWLFKGIAEFQLNQFTQAKASFDKVLALDPNSAPAKKYESELPGPGVTRIILTPVAQKDFEAELGVQFDPQKLSFASAFSFPPQQGSTQTTTANYSSAMSLAAVTKYLTSALGQAPDSAATSTVKGLVTFHKSLPDKKASYIVSLNQESKVVMASINYNQQ
jgi:hypothetical protein